MKLEVMLSKSHSPLYGTVQLQLHTRVTSRVVHVCFSVDREIITRVPTNSQACKLNMRDSYTSCSHACAIYFLVLSAYESRPVAQFYKSNATSALVAG